MDSVGRRCPARTGKTPNLRRLPGGYVKERTGWTGHPRAGVEKAAPAPYAGKCKQMVVNVKGGDGRRGGRASPARSGAVTVWAGHGVRWQSGCGDTALGGKERRGLRGVSPYESAGAARALPAYLHSDCRRRNATAQSSLISGWQSFGNGRKNSPSSATLARIHHEC